MEKPEVGIIVHDEEMPHSLSFYNSLTDELKSLDHPAALLTKSENGIDAVLIAFGKREMESFEDAMSYVERIKQNSNDKPVFLINHNYPYLNPVMQEQLKKAFGVIPIYLPETRSSSRSTLIQRKHEIEKEYALHAAKIIAEHFESLSYSKK